MSSPLCFKQLLLDQSIHDSKTLESAIIVKNHLRQVMLILHKFNFKFIMEIVEEKKIEQFCSLKIYLCRIINKTQNNKYYGLPVTKDNFGDTTANYVELSRKLNGVISTNNKIQYGYCIYDIIYVCLFSKENGILYIKPLTTRGIQFRSRVD